MKNKTFSIKEALSFGWEKQQSSPLFFAGIALVAILPSIFFGAITDALENAVFFVRIGIDVISMIVFFFLSLGIRKITLDAYDSKKLKFSDIFSQKNLLVSVIGAGIIYFAIVSIGLIVLIIPGIFFFCRFFFFELAIVDKKLGAVDSLEESWKITRGNTFKIFFFLLIILGINILGILALFVGLLIAVPVSALSLTYAYRKLSEAHDEEVVESTQHDNVKEEE
jgi:uncharacterized membrane protein